jgi:hypothetical protein
VEEAVLQSQDAALQRLLARDFDGTLLRFVEQTLATPPRSAPDVPFDFWPQFDQFDRLEELRQFRPAVYRALPLAPGMSGSVVRGPGSANTGDSPSSGSGSRIPGPGSRR